MTEREFASSVVHTLQGAGFEALWAGGCVRDELLGLTPDDYDVATNAIPEQVQKLFRHTVAIGVSFGVIEVIGPKADGEWRKVQVATFRSDGTYSDGRRPDSVTFGTVEADARRRDFTVNGVFFDPIRNTHLDFVGGRADLAAKILRAIGDPAARFTEDKLRVLRAVRMATRFGLRVEPATLAAAKAVAPGITAVSPERIAEELRKLLTNPRRADGWKLFVEIGLVPPILPEVIGREAESGDALASLPHGSSFPLALAAILRSLDAKAARKVARRLRLSNDVTERIHWLVAMQSSLRSHLLPSKLFPILIHPGCEELIALHRALGPPLDEVNRAEAILRTTSRDSLDPPALLSGDDLVAQGWIPGPAFKKALDTVREAQLDGRITTPEEAVELVNLSMK